MESLSTVGAEIEFNLYYPSTHEPKEEHDQPGFLANVAPLILKNPFKPSWLVYEGTNAQVEINSRPTSTIHELHLDLKEKCLELEQICQRHDVIPIPLCEFGAGRGELNKDIERLEVYIKILGEKTLCDMITNVGIHLHIAQLDELKIEQLRLINALDPLSYAITSTSPISPQRKNGLNCYRIHRIRKEIFQDFPLHSQLQPYLDSPNDLNRINKFRRQKWRDKALAEGISPEKFDRLFQEDDTGWTPFRKRDPSGEKFSPGGTWEVRSFDATTLDVFLAAAALYKGVYDHAKSSDIRTYLANQPHTRYSFCSFQLLLPSFTTLKNLQNQSIQHGLQSLAVHDYLSHVLPFAEVGLPIEDRPYLEPIREMLRTKKNPAAQLMDFMREQGHQENQFTPHQVAQANLFMRKQYERSLQ